MIVPAVVLVTETQLVRTSDEQVPSDVRLITVFDSMSLASCNVGLIMSFPSLMNTFSSSSVVCSNSPLLESGR